MPSARFQHKQRILYSFFAEPFQIHFCGAARRASFCDYVIPSVTVLRLPIVVSFLILVLASSAYESLPPRRNLTFYIIVFLQRTAVPRGVTDPSLLQFGLLF
jgi:hypothetical protein